jgi:hypothetical protein
VIQGPDNDPCAACIAGNNTIKRRETTTMTPTETDAVITATISLFLLDEESFGRTTEICGNGVATCGLAAAGF